MCACCGAGHNVRRRSFCESCWRCWDVRVACQRAETPVLDSCERQELRFHAYGVGKNTLVDVNGAKFFATESQNNALRMALERRRLPDVPIRLVVNSKAVYDQLRSPHNSFAKRFSHVQYKVEWERDHDPALVAAHDKLRVYLRCPYGEKDMCKRLGGVWCPRVRSWFTFKPVRHRFKWRARKLLLDTKR